MTGLLKEAAPVPKGVLRSLAGKFSKYWAKNRPTWQGVKDYAFAHRPTWAGTKRFMVGEPGKFFKEVRQGKAFAPGGVLRQGIRESTEGALGKAMFYGLPALEAYNIATGPEQGRAERMGGLLASTPVWLAAWKPFGMVGSTILGTAAEAAGRGAGRLLSGQKPVKRQPPAHYLYQEYQRKAPKEYRLPEKYSQYAQYAPSRFELG